MSAGNALILAAAMLVIGLVAGGSIIAIRQVLRDAGEFAEDLADTGQPRPGDPPAWGGPPP